MPRSLPIVEMSRRYCEPHRRYHTIDHIAHMLWVGRTHALTDEQIAAVWYHDAIFDPRRNDNEERSAELAAAQLPEFDWPPSSVELVHRIVLDTKLHAPSCDASRAVLDLDLHSLASDREVFDRNGQRIRAEYAHLADADYAAGQRRFFEAILARDQIYWTTWGTRLEETARANIRHALRELL